MLKNSWVTMHNRGDEVCTNVMGSDTLWVWFPGSGFPGLVSYGCLGLVAGSGWQSQGCEMKDPDVD